MSFLAELYAFMRARKKFWLLPIVIMMAIFGGLITDADSPRRTSRNGHGNADTNANARALAYGNSDSNAAPFTHTHAEIARS